MCRWWNPSRCGPRHKWQRHTRRGRSRRDGTDAGGAGVDGFSTLLTLTESTDAQSGAPCVEIAAGLDNGDGNGVARNEVLETGEIDSTATLCTPTP